MLVLTGQDLCTASFMTGPMAALHGRVKVWEIPVNWMLVFFGNLAGGLTFVAFLGESCNPPFVLCSRNRPLVGLVQWSRHLCVLSVGCCLQDEPGLG